MSCQRVVWSLVVVLLTFITDVCQAGQFCYFLHEDYYTLRQIYCESGCCRDYGDDDEICCFTWSVGVILGIGFACVGFIAVVIFLVICCQHMKKRGRLGSVVHPAGTGGAHGTPYPQNNTFVYASAPPAYQYAAYPPQNIYSTPGSVAPPPYTAGTQPAYAPPSMNNPNDMSSGNAHGGPTAPTNPAYPPRSYGGYGTGEG
ncbi:uncharacterized protein LOC128204109 [Mya arenaria]|uniref:uncharacterized protein LOC128204109 n=1 Tax=Mya arenaria TaxID=6604 RepID=UPI0022E5472E|nr:uncharacterized protein LOC128204109 [Mya arenaria]